ncbi:hypothetical protein BSKO_03938 [Bryopsis sp. KO-2023]|nr:hypothetical protein BSKO_03938 [Bryopsis sp. KO-2023]
MAVHFWKYAWGRSSLLLTTIFSTLCVLTVAAPSEFRTGLVLNASNDLSFERLRGYSLFLSEFARIFPDGMPLGKGGDFRFNFSFEAITEVLPSRTEDQLSDLVATSSTTRNADTGVHFLFGVEYDAELALRSGEFAERKKRVMLHCCAEDNVFAAAERRWEYFFTMIPPYEQASLELVDGLVVEDIGTVAVVYDESVPFFKAACEYVIAQTMNLTTIDVVFNHKSTGAALADPETAQSIVDEMIAQEPAAIIGCTSEVETENIINGFWKRRYGLKGQAYTSGPANNAFVQKLGERVRGVMGIETFHSTAKFADDGFFGTPQTFAEKIGVDGDVLYGVPEAAASFYVLMLAIKDAFMDCDISGANGDTDRLLFEEGSISCPDYKNSGYERIRLSLRFLSIPTSILGPIEFNKFNQNIRRSYSSLITQVGLDDLVPRVVSPSLYSSAQFTLPVRNPFKPLVCAPGEFKSTDQFEPCKPCPKGSVSKLPDSPQCTVCSQNSTATEYSTSCVPCPKNAYTPAQGASSIDECQCRPSYFNWALLDDDVDAPLNCTKCPIGATCNGSNSTPVPMEGFWADPEKPEEVHECDVVEKCPAGFECAVDSSGKPKFEGRLCEDCADGYFTAMEKCRKCVSTGATLALVVLLLSVWYFVNSVVSTRVDTFEMVLNQIQLVSIVGSLDLNWPSSLVSAFDVASILDFDTDAVEPSCIWPQWSFRSNFIVQLLLPILLSAIAFLKYLVYHIRYTGAIRNIHKKRSPPGNFRRILTRGLDAMGFMVPARTADDWLDEKWGMVIAQTLSAIEVTYLTITRYCCEVLRCETIAGVKVMSASLSIECSSDEYRFLHALAIAGLIVYTLGYIVFSSFCLLWMHYHMAYSSKKNLVRYGFLYERFELGYSWIAVASLFVRIGFVMSLVLVDDQKAAAGLMSLMTIGWLLIQVYTLPYVSSSLDFLQTCMLVGLLIVSFSGLMYSHDPPLTDIYRKRIERAEIAAIGIMVAVTILFLIRELVVKTRIAIIQRRHKQAVLRSFPKDVDRNIVRNDVVSSGLELELYDTFQPEYLYSWLKDADQETLMDFDKLSVMLQPYLSEDSYSSYLSQEIVARFWRKFVSSFPEIIDYLLTVDESSRTHFCQFSLVLYRGFFLRHYAKGARFHSLIDWKDRAALAQWLALSSYEDRQFFTRTALCPFRKFAHTESQVPENERNFMEKFLCKHYVAEGAPVHHNPACKGWHKWLQALQTKTSITWRSALQELASGRGPLAHEKKPEFCTRSDLCKFARQVTQARRNKEEYSPGESSEELHAEKENMDSAGTSYSASQDNEENVDGDDVPAGSKNV